MASEAITESADSDYCDLKKLLLYPHPFVASKLSNNYHFVSDACKFDEELPDGMPMREDVCLKGAYLNPALVRSLDMLEHARTCNRKPCSIRATVDFRVAAFNAHKERCTTTCDKCANFKLMAVDHVNSCAGDCEFKFNIPPAERVNPHNVHFRRGGNKIELPSIQMEMLNLEPEINANAHLEPEMNAAPNGAQNYAASVGAQMNVPHVDPQVNALPPVGENEQFMPIPLNSRVEPTMAPIADRRLNANSKSFRPQRSLQVQNQQPMLYGSSIADATKPPMLYSQHQHVGANGAVLNYPTRGSTDNPGVMYQTTRQLQYPSYQQQNYMNSVQPQAYQLPVSELHSNQHGPAYWQNTGQPYSSNSIPQRQDNYDNYQNVANSYNQMYRASIYGNWYNQHGRGYWGPNENNRPPKKNLSHFQSGRSRQDGSGRRSSNPRSNSRQRAQRRSSYSSGAEGSAPGAPTTIAPAPESRSTAQAAKAQKQEVEATNLVSEMHPVKTSTPVLHPKTATDPPEPVEPRDEGAAAVPEAIEEVAPTSEATDNAADTAPTSLDQPDNQHIMQTPQVTSVIPMSYIFGGTFPNYYPFTYGAVPGYPMYEFPGVVQQNQLFTQPPLLQSTQLAGYAHNPPKRRLHKSKFRRSHLPRITEDPDEEVILRPRVFPVNRST